MGKGEAPPVFCICRQPDDGSIMIECNYCEDWFHIACVGVSNDALDGLKEYRCPSCQEKGEVYTGSAEGEEEEEESEVRTRKKSSTQASNKRHKSKMEENKKFPHYQEEDDPARKTVIEGLTNVLSPFWVEHCIFASVEELATAIESEMFTQLAEPTPEVHSGDVSRCGNAYKAKYRTLQFNLKDPKNQSLRDAVFSGGVTVRRLVSMKPSEMANAEIAREIKAIREESLSKVVLEEETTENSLVKKTHKGEDYVKAEDSGDASLLNSYMPSKSIPVSPSHSIAAAGGEDSLTKSPPAACEEDLEWSDEWFGKIYIPDFEVRRLACFARHLAHSNAKVRQNFTSRDLKRLLPHNLHCSGRIAMKTASEYAGQVWSGSSSRDIILFDVISPSEEELARLVKHLSEHNRWAVVAHDPSRGIRDFYLAPASSDLDRSLLPPYSNNSSNSPSTNSTALIGVLVIAKDGGRSMAAQNADTYDPEQHSSPN